MTMMVRAPSAAATALCLLAGVLLLLSGAQAVSYYCEHAGWQLGVKKCFQLQGSSANSQAWQDGYDTCDALGVQTNGYNAHLPQFNSTASYYEEIDAVVTAGEVPDGRTVWLGLTKNAGKLSWDKHSYWRGGPLNGTQPLEFPWAPIQPSGNGNCTQMNFYQSGHTQDRGLWDDLACVAFAARPTMCQLDALVSPTAAPTLAPTLLPSAQPTTVPTRNPTVVPTKAPTDNPSTQPSTNPTQVPSFNPSGTPSPAPTQYPSNYPSYTPTYAPSVGPTTPPTPFPSTYPTDEPTKLPTVAPSANPTDAPTEYPTEYPTYSPSPAPTEAPSPAPSANPTDAPTDNPTEYPTYSPSPAPTEPPSPAPTLYPTYNPTDAPTNYPTYSPTPYPTRIPTAAPTDFPTMAPTIPVPCPPRWFRVNGNCYKLSRFTINSWYVANDLCEEQGGYMSQFDDLTDYLDVLTYVYDNKGVDGNDRIWLGGLRDATDDGLAGMGYVWQGGPLDGTVLTPGDSLYAPGQPSIQSSDVTTIQYVLQANYGGLIDDVPALGTLGRLVLCQRVATTSSPTPNPTSAPTEAPSPYPTYNPTEYPTPYPSKSPTDNPTPAPTEYPTLFPTYLPTEQPTGAPTFAPSVDPCYANRAESPTFDFVTTGYDAGDAVFVPGQNSSRGLDHEFGTGSYIHVEPCIPLNETEGECSRWTLEWWFYTVDTDCILPEGMTLLSQLGAESSILSLLAANFPQFWDGENTTVDYRRMSIDEHVRYFAWNRANLQIADEWIALTINDELVGVVDREIVGKYDEARPRPFCMDRLVGAADLNTSWARPIDNIALFKGCHSLRPWENETCHNEIYVTFECGEPIGCTEDSPCTQTPTLSPTFFPSILPRSDEPVVVCAGGALEYASVDELFASEQLESPGFVDLTNNDLDDIFALDNANSILHIVWNTDGTPSGTVFSSISLGGSYDKAISVDWDNDGWTDVALIDYANGCVMLVKNNAGSLTAGTATEWCSLVDGPSDIYAFDVNDDKIDDIVVTSLDDSAVYWISYNSGSPVKKNAGSVTKPTEVVVADFNLDGVADIIASSFSRANESLVWIQGKKTAGPISFKTPVIIWDVNTTTSGDPGVRDMTIGDLDGDGLEDVVVCSANEGVYWFETLGAGNPPISSSGEQIAGSILDCASVVTEDVDLNGNPDVLIGGLGVRIYLNDGVDVFTKELQISFNDRLDSSTVLSAPQIATGDTNNDGFPEVFASDSSAANQGLFWKNNCTTNAPTWAPSPAPTIAPSPNPPDFQCGAGTINITVNVSGPAWDGSFVLLSSADATDGSFTMQNPGDNVESITLCVSPNTEYNVSYLRLGNDSDWVNAFAGYEMCGQFNSLLSGTVIRTGASDGVCWHVCDYGTEVEFVMWPESTDELTALQVWGDSEVGTLLTAYASEQTECVPVIDDTIRVYFPRCDDNVWICGDYVPCAFGEASPALGPFPVHFSTVDPTTGSCSVGNYTATTQGGNGFYNITGIRNVNGHSVVGNYSALDVIDTGVNQVSRRRRQLQAGGERELLSDDEIVVVNTTFSFNVFGSTFDQLSISTNGIVGMGPNSLSSLSEQLCCTTNKDMTDAGYTGPDWVVAPFWVDLDPSVAGTIYAGTVDSNTFAVVYDNITYQATNDQATVELVFTDTDIAVNVIQTGTNPGTNDVRAKVSIGVRGASSTDAVQLFGPTMDVDHVEGVAYLLTPNN